jgi:hypothetical protein
MTGTTGMANPWRTNRMSVHMTKQKTVPVFGYCPMGCGQTLALLSNGFIVCETPNCPRADAATEILADSETEHILKLTWHDFTIRHPLQERLDDKLMSCKLHTYMIDILDNSPLYNAGEYRVSATENPEKPWKFKALSVAQGL